MKKIKIIDLAKKLNVTHSAVSQWFNGRVRPSYLQMLRLHREHGIPFTAWEDIKVWLKEQEKKETKR